MTFNEFVIWCDERACDGCWGMNEAIICAERINEIKKRAFWKREKEWKKTNKMFDIVKSIVEPTNAKIKEVFG